MKPADSQHFLHDDGRRYTNEIWEGTYHTKRTMQAALLKAIYPHALMLKPIRRALTSCKNIQ
ncbi:hypothetical protein C0J52_18416 [Blattella germanica]|nr:hypothetical protein C0J52_18416 [Blattella germanica]